MAIFRLIYSHAMRGWENWEDATCLSLQSEISKPLNFGEFASDKTLVLTKIIMPIT